MESVDEMLRGLLRKEPEESRESWIEGDAMIIDCRGCRYLPMPGSDECIGCMVSEMCRMGGAPRIILRTGKDTEVSGQSGRAIKEAASLKRWALPAKPLKGRCSKCALSRESLVEAAWDGFPRRNTYAAYAMLDGETPAGRDCEECKETSRRALAQMDRRLDELLERMGSQ